LLPARAVTAAVRAAGTHETVESTVTARRIRRAPADAGVGDHAAREAHDDCLELHGIRGQQRVAHEDRVDLG
jgi:hypothetical protein